MAELVQSSSQTSINQLNSSMSSLDSFLLTGMLNVTALSASVDSVAAAIVPPQPTTSSTLTGLAAAEARPTSQSQEGMYVGPAYNKTSSAENYEVMMRMS